MRIASADGRLVLVTQSGDLVDVEQASDGRFGADPQAVYEVWRDFTAWARQRDDVGPGDVALDDATLARLDAPVPRPRQLFGVGLNYVDHVEESGAQAPEVPTIFTKFVSCLTGPTGTIQLPGKAVDWEVELVVVIGTGGRGIARADAWGHVAGLTGGQDLSERDVQLRPPGPQFSIGKSFEKFGPTGPVVATIDEFPDPDDVGLRCVLNGDTVQDATSRLLVFGVPELVEYLSGIVELYPGDLIFTGTPAGVGLGRRPPEYLKPGDVVETHLADVGSMRHEFVEG